MSKKISIGIIAYNEQENIAELIADIAKQTLLSCNKFIFKVYVVANGCTDDTAAVSQAKLAQHFPTDRYAVLELDIPSKTNSWNVFVHDIQDLDSDYTIMMDADIRIDQAKLMSVMVEFLERNSETLVVLGQSRKMFPEDTGVNLIVLLRKLFQGSISNQKTGFCGQLYCSRTREIRRVVLPVGLLSQDGFIRAMILTAGLTQNENSERIHMLAHQYHLHPDHITVSSVFRYEKRQAIGTALYQIIYRELHRLPKDFDARMAEIALRNSDNPDWVHDLLVSQIESGELLVPWSYRMRSVKRLTEQRGPKIAFRALFVPLLLIFDLYVCWRAETELARGSFGTLQLNRGKFKSRSDNHQSA